MIEDPHIQYRYKNFEKNSEQIDQLNINVALMTQQYESMERAIDKMNTVMDRAIDKMTTVLERLEERLEVLEKEKLKEQAIKDGKNTVISYFTKYWWAALFVVYFFSNDPEFLAAIKKIFA